MQFTPDLTDLELPRQGQVPPLLWIYGPLWMAVKRSHESRWSRWLGGEGVETRSTLWKVFFWNGKQKGRMPNLGCRNWEKTKVLRRKNCFEMVWLIFVGHVKIMQCHACPFESMWSTCTMSIHFNWFPHVANMCITIDQVIFNDTWSTYTQNTSCAGWFSDEWTPLLNTTGLEARNKGIPAFHRRDQAQ